MLSPFQERVAEIIADLDEAKEFALAGGAALISRGDVDRQTRDLDFFGPTSASVDKLVPAVERVLRDAGMVVRGIQVNPGFARLVVEEHGDEAEVDLAADARLFPAEPGPLVPTLAGKELAVDKVLAIFGRAEARDFIDLSAVEGRYGIENLCELAADKDPGFTPIMFARMLSRFDRLGRQEFEIDDDQFALLGSAVQAWRERTLELARSRGRNQEVSRDRGLDTGLGI
ncbi:MAG TPA: nucleotidyl transferase AbiEii/AbiGii toxin family protein [Acidimicrobiales bacterium]|nr:nucleotidyl transferase AbiEii/AbiGii toxin family protein [Acidimicrobiales bacterium]